MGGEIFRTRPDRLWCPPGLLCNGYRVFPGVKRPGHGVVHPLPSSTEDKERVELFLYSTSGPSCPVLGRTLLLILLLFGNNDDDDDDNNNNNMLDAQTYLQVLKLHVALFLGKACGMY